MVVGESGLGKSTLVKKSFHDGAAKMIETMMVMMMTKRMLSSLSYNRWRISAWEVGFGTFHCLLKITCYHFLPKIGQVNSMFLTDIYNSTTNESLESKQTIEVCHYLCL